MDLAARLAEAVRLLDYALHLRMYGERAPGGNETWRQFDRDAETFLRAEIDRRAVEKNEQETLPI